MTTFIQLLLAVVISSLSFLVLVVGIQVYHLLFEFRQAVKKLNKVLDNTLVISDSVAKPVTAVNDFFAEVKDLVNHTDDQIIEETPDKVISPPRFHSIRPLQRFFRRSGLPLRPS